MHIFRWFSEPFLESIPQVFILLCILTAGQGDKIFELDYFLFWSTCVTSVFSAALALTKFLKNGPCRLLPTSGLLAGFCHCGFIVTFLVNLFCLGFKGFTLGLLLNVAFKNTFKTTGVWMCSNMIPQFVFVSIFCHLYYYKLTGGVSVHVFGPQ